MIIVINDCRIYCAKIPLMMFIHRLGKELTRLGLIEGESLKCEESFANKSNLQGIAKYD